MNLKVCSNGKVNPEPFSPLPQQLMVLFEGTIDQSVRFLQDIRKYNSAFQLTSLGCKEVRMNGWNPQFRIQGQVCHLIDPLEPADEMQARFLQIYFMNGDQQIQRKSSITGRLCNSILLDIQEAFNQHHKYLKELKCANEFASSRQIENFRIVLNETARPLGIHERIQNAPTLNMVAILLPNNPVGHRDIVLHTRSDQLQRISEFHKAYDSLQYPILFPHAVTVGICTR